MYKCHKRRKLLLVGIQAGCTISHSSQSSVHEVTYKTRLSPGTNEEVFVAIVFYCEQVYTPLQPLLPIDNLVELPCFCRFCTDHFRKRCLRPARFSSRFLRLVCGHSTSTILKPKCNKSHRSRRTAVGI